MHEISLKYCSILFFYKLHLVQNLDPVVFMEQLKCFILQFCFVHSISDCWVKVNLYKNNIIVCFI